MIEVATSTIMIAKTVRLSNGQQLPLLGLGTWQGGSHPEEVEEAVEIAIDAGYRHFDCAMVYGNEKEIGKAIKRKIAAGVVKREELFVVTKLWNTSHEREKVLPTCKKSLENFGLDYIDLYLIHWPVAQRVEGEFDNRNPFNRASGIDYDYVETWKGMEDCVRAGLTRGIGLSNFNSQQIDRVLAAATIKPVVNQVEVQPNLNQKKLIQFCKDRDIVIVAYSPFGSPSRPWAKPGDPVLALDDPKITAIAKKYGKSGGQVVLRYLLDIGTVPIPKSSAKKRIIENIQVFDFQLTADEIAIMDSFNCNGRAVPASELKGSPNYPFDIEF